MKRFLLASSFVSLSAQAQLVECPKFYPSQDMVLPDAPTQHKGKGLLRKAQLTGAAMSEGDFNGGAMSLMHGLRKQTKGDVEEDFPKFRGSKWLVCYYGPGNISWWAELGSEPTACKLKITKRNANEIVDASVSCK